NNSTNSWEEYTGNYPDIKAKVEIDGFIRLEVYNDFDNTLRCGFGTDAEPALRIGGSLKVDYDPAISKYRDEDSIAKYGSRNLQLDNRRIPFRRPLYRFANYLRDRATRLVSLANQALEAPGDARVQLGDTILVRDEERFGEAFKIQVTGITGTFSRDGGLTDS